MWRVSLRKISFARICVSSDYVAGFLTCGVNGYVESMCQQLQGASIACFSNGADVRVPIDVWMLGNETNIGWGPGFNQFVESLMRFGVRYAWICNDDITGVSPELGHRLCDILKADAAIAVVSPAILGNWYLGMRPIYRGLQRRRYVDFTAPMLSLEAWQRIGPLDTSFSRGGGLDVDWCARARSMGYDVCVDYDAVIDHPFGSPTCRATGTYATHEDIPWRSWVAHKHGVEDWFSLVKE